MTIAGLVLAAGAGSRFGQPKATVVDAAGPWITRVCSTLRAAGADPVYVVLGAAADEALPLVPTWATAVVAADWATGMSASLVAGLAALESRDCSAVVIALVDQPDLPVEAVAAVVAEVDASSVRRATTGGHPNHPVVIGRDHWPALLASLSGDRGAGPWLLTRPELQWVPTDPWWDGADHDEPVA